MSNESLAGRATARDDIVVAALKKRYFEVIQKEDYPRTPKLSAEADHLEDAIRTLQLNRSADAGGGRS